MEQRIARVTAPGGEEIAYASVGDGPPLVLAAWWTSHLELDWDNESIRSFLETLAQRHTVVRYDRPGVGLSGRGDRPFDLDAETEYLRTVVDATGAEEVDLMGISCGGPASIRFAAEEPGRTGRLLLYASYLDGREIAEPATKEALADLVRANWGLGSQTLTNLFLPDASAPEARRFASSQRHTADADVAARLLELTFELDATPYVDQLDVPVLVLHRVHDRVVGSALGRNLAERTPGAAYEELEGKAHSPWSGDTEHALQAISAFLTDAPAPPAPQRELATVCFVDIVDSTRVLAEIGDRRWRERLDELAAILTEEAEHRGGTYLKDTGDGAMLRFGLPGDALAFCQAARSRARAMGVAIRCGLHTGELETRGDDITGIAVVAAARTAALAGADEILVTRTVAELTAGGATPLADHGRHELKGLDGEWALLSAAPLGGPDPERTAPTGSPVSATYTFGDYVLDPAAFELRCGGEVVSLEPQVFDVLLYLVEHRDEMVTKEQILDDVWGDRFVSESALTSRIRSARKAVGDDGRRQDLIRTVHGRGYRFVADVR